ncbi:MAG: DUF4296 domain-containing protein [Bacteroidales bacterium]
MKYHLYCIGLLLFATLLSNCAFLEGRIPEKKLVRILSSIHLADAVLEKEGLLHSIAIDSAGVYLPILRSYNYTFDQLQVSLQYYTTHPEAANRLYGKVIKNLEKQQKQYAKEYEALLQRQNRWLTASEFRIPEDTPSQAFIMPIIDSAGIYTLTFDLKIMSTCDLGVLPQISLQLIEINSDSILHQTNKKIACDTIEHNYSLSITNFDTHANHIRIYFLNDVDSPVYKLPEGKVRNIRLHYTPPQKQVLPKTSFRLL